MGFLVQADALFFQALENGVHYAIVDGKVHNPDFHTHLGGRIKVGIEVGEDAWQIGVQFLHYHSRTRGEISSKEIFPTWTHPLRGSGAFATHASNLWRLHLGIADVYLTKRWCVSSFLELWPYFGISYAEVRHKLLIEYEGGTFQMPEDLSMKNKFMGIGPEVGIGAIWWLNSWMGLYSRTGMSLFFGQIYIHQDENVKGRKDLGKIKFLDRYHQTRQLLEMALGLEFRYCALYVRVGWEMYFLMSQNELVRFPSSQMPGLFVANQGDLTLQGFSIGAGFTF